MKFGILFRIQDPPNGEKIGQRMRETISCAELAEQVGFDGVFLPEHHMMDDGYLPNPFPLMGAIAARTKRVHIGTTVHLLPFYNPIQTAEAAAVVDQIAGGRIRLGVGIGNFEPEFELMGMEKSGQAQRFAEAIELLQKAWSGEEFDHQGDFYQAKGKIRPIPLDAQLWIGAMSDAGVRRAAKFGCPWPTDPIHNISVIGHWADTYRAAAAQQGTNASVILLRDAWLADSLDEVERIWWPRVRADHWMYFKEVPRFIASLEPTLQNVHSEEDFTFENHHIDRLIVGTPQECIATIRRMQKEIGMDYLILTFRYATGPDHESHLECIRRFGEEVIPAFRS
jgi:alkanesulfonate monooxygenase SsuD/methylene tetrahydromethanopterin reductase-like flavin-dependent oxidoreductase (luciferase family)|tara:strand:- start:213 stop:1229 length:1017 start_codon:yes stop_codon:yes gene_type:complete